VPFSAINTVGWPEAVIESISASFKTSIAAKAGRIGIRIETANNRGNMSFFTFVSFTSTKGIMF
jgi:hypothetical protein